MACGGSLSCACGDGDLISYGTGHFEQRLGREER